MKNKKITLLSVLFVFLLTLSVYVYVNYNNQTQVSVLSDINNIVFVSQKECERETGEKCTFQNCDLDCPEGFKKGWTAPIAKGASCGLSVSNISRNQKVSFPLEIKGIVDNTLNCDSKWTMFEGQAGIVELYFNHDGGWKQITNGIPVLVSEWMTEKTDFSVVLNFNNGGIGLPDGTEMKIVFKEEDLSGKGEADTVELLVILKNASAVETSNWKTYKNEKYGYELLIPNTWKIQDDTLTYECCLGVFSSFEPYEKDRLKSGIVKIQFQSLFNTGVSSKEQFIRLGLKDKEAETLITNVDSVQEIENKSGLKILGFSSAISTHAYFIPKKPDFSEGILVFVWGESSPEIKSILSFFKFTK